MPAALPGLALAVVGVLIAYRRLAAHDFLWTAMFGGFALLALASALGVARLGEWLERQMAPSPSAGADAELRHRRSIVISRVFQYAILVSVALLLAIRR